MDYRQSKERTVDTFELEHQARVLASVGALDALAGVAETSKESGKDASKYAQAFDSVLTLVSMDETENPNAQSILDYLTGARDALKSASGQDRSEGDALATRVRAGLQSGYPLEDAVKDAADKAITRWTASAPSKSGSKRASGEATRSKTLKDAHGMEVEIRCSCGYVGHDGTDANSARWNEDKHLRDSKSHPTFTVAPGKGSPDWQKVTDAVYGVVGHLDPDLAGGTRGDSASATTAPLSDGTVATFTLQSVS